MYLDLDDSNSYRGRNYYNKNPVGWIELFDNICDVELCQIEVDYKKLIEMKINEIIKLRISRHKTDKTMFFKLALKEIHKTNRGLPKPKQKVCTICNSLHFNKDQFCSSSCRIIYCEIKNIPYQIVDISYKCTHCGKFFNVKKRKRHKFCSIECSRKYHSGKNHPSYIDGSSKKYCPKFNEDLKRRVRLFFDDKCFMCGKSTVEEGYNLSIHHVNYNKWMCCDDSPALLVPLCRQCHGKTNSNRKHYQNLFEALLKENYNYKCYYTKEEEETIFGALAQELIDKLTE